MSQPPTTTRVPQAGIEEKTGVRPDKYVQYAALRGDNSDNLPGVPGVGEKTAAKLINTYGGLDGIFEHVEEQTPKLRANLAEHEERARMFRILSPTAKLNLRPKVCKMPPRLQGSNRTLRQGKEECRF